MHGKLPPYALLNFAIESALKAAYPAFYALYVSSERRTSVQAMQLSNGLADPSGLWIGHLLFDGMFSTAASVVIIIVFATVTDQFHGLGLFVSQISHDLASYLNFFLSSGLYYFCMGWRGRCSRIASPWSPTHHSLPLLWLQATKLLCSS